MSTRNTKITFQACILHIWMFVFVVTAQINDIKNQKINKTNFWKAKIINY